MNGEARGKNPSTAVSGGTVVVQFREQSKAGNGCAWLSKVKETNGVDQTVLKRERTNAALQLACA